MAIRESVLEKRFKDTCKSKGVRTVKVDPKQNNGFPDRIVFNVLVGEIHYIELKNETYYGRTHNQKVWASIIEKCGGTYFLLDGDDEVDKYLKKYIIDYQSKKEVKK